MTEAPQPTRLPWPRRALGILLVPASFAVAIWGPFFTGLNFLCTVLILFIALRVGTLPLVCPECAKRMWVVRGDASNLHCITCGAAMNGTGDGTGDGTGAATGDGSGLGWSSAGHDSAGDAA